MAQLISEIWEGLRSAGLPEVMLYLADHSASRCHWDDTTLINDVRVALLADQDRQIVRILPVDSCVGIGIASPKGTDPSGYKIFIQQKLRRAASGEPEPEPVSAPAPAPAPPPPPAVVVPPPPPAPAPPEVVATRFGMAMKPSQPARYGGVASGHR